MYGRYLAQAGQRQFGAAFRTTTPQFALPPGVKQYNVAAVQEIVPQVRREKAGINKWFYNTFLQKTSSYFFLVGVLAVTFDTSLREATSRYVAYHNKGRSFNDMITTFPAIPPGIDLDEDEE